MSAFRKLKRSKQKQAKKNMQITLGLFDKIPDHCLTCYAPYDKMNKEQVKTWNVVVREKEDRVNLYCPDCWKKATNLLEEMNREIQEMNNEIEEAINDE